MILKLLFHPQVRVNDEVMEVESPEGPAKWEVEVLDNYPIPEDDDYESDNLRYEGDAPKWIQEWSGPFWVEVLNRDELERKKS